MRVAVPLTILLFVTAALMLTATAGEPSAASLTGAHLVTESVSPRLALDTPAERPSTTPSTRPSPAGVWLYGDVRDGRALPNPNIVIPNDLPPVPGATVGLPTFGLQTLTDSQGKFGLWLGDLNSRCGTDVIVSAPGFGLWTYHQMPIETYADSGGGIRLFIQLNHGAQESTYWHKRETPAPACRADSLVR